MPQALTSKARGKGGKVQKIGPYSRSPALANLDMRTREGRIIRDTRAALSAHLGGNLSATQRAMVERAAHLSMQVAMLDAKCVAGTMTHHDGREYLAWTNALTRLLRQLGMKGAADRPPSLADHLAKQAAAAP